MARVQTSQGVFPAVAATVDTKIAWHEEVTTRWVRNPGDRRWSPRNGLVHVVLAGPPHELGGPVERQVQEKELFLGANNAWLAGEVGVLEAGAVDAHVGERRRVREADGDLDGVAFACLGSSRGGV